MSAKCRAIGGLGGDNGVVVPHFEFFGHAPKKPFFSDFLQTGALKILVIIPGEKYSKIPSDSATPGISNLTGTGETPQNKTPHGNSSKPRAQVTTGGILPELGNYSKMMEFR